MDNFSANSDTSATAPTKRSSRLGTAIRTLIGLLVLVVLLLLSYQTQQLQRSVQVQQYQARTNLHEQQQMTQTLHQTIAQLQQQSQQQQTHLIQLDQQVTRLTQQAGGNSKPWKIAEIVYLVRLADLQLKVQHAIPAALTLLTQAQKETVALAEPSLTGFRQELLKNVSALQNLSSLDIPTIATQLSTLQNDVPSLSLLVAPKPGTSPLNDSAHQEHKKWWQRAWDNMRASFKALVIVRHEDNPLPALMPPEQQTYLQQNLQLLLIQARWALLNQQPALYQSNLKEAHAWVQKFYVQNSATTQTFLKQLENLQAINIAPTLPDLTHTLSLLPQE